jgi:hypothetical protein
MLCRMKSSFSKVRSPGSVILVDPRNPSYLEDGDWEPHDSKLTWAKNSCDPISAGCGGTCDPDYAEGISR